MTKVLLVDDDDALLQSFKQSLPHFAPEVEVRTAPSGAIAMQILDAETIDQADGDRLHRVVGGGAVAVEALVLFLEGLPQPMDPGPGTLTEILLAPMNVSPRRSRRRLPVAM